MAMIRTLAFLAPLLAAAINATTTGVDEIPSSKWGDIKAVYK